MSEMIIIPVQVEAEDFWSNLLGSAWEDWDWWQAISYSEGSQWDKVGEITISITDPDDEEEEQVITKTLGVQDLANAYAKYISQTKNSVDWQDFDACSGDAVLQVAVLGDVVYG